MDFQRHPTVFLSHAHRDKRVARCLVRRLAAHSINVRIDERDLQIGSTLTSAISKQIEVADVVVVIASHASADSKWVGLELDYAREHGKSIVPFFIDPLAEHKTFRDYLGVDATDPHTFGDVVHDLTRNLFLSCDLELPPADPAVLTAGLRQLAKAEPDLAPLIDGCLDGKGLHMENMDTVYNGPFHALDDALNSLFDLMPNSVLAYHAAVGFCRAGAGIRALSLWIKATGDGAGPLTSAVGAPLAAVRIPTAIALLAACSPPNNAALYQFIHNNADRFDNAQRAAVIRLVTWPVRADTGRSGNTLGWIAFQHFPDAVEIQQMWVRWVGTGTFDGTPHHPADLARYLADAKKKGLPGWEPVHDALRSHVREHLRSGDKDRVMTAMDHIEAAAEEGAPVLDVLLEEAEGVSATAEWNEWRERDRENADWARLYVSAIAEEAAGDRNWVRALQHVETMVRVDKVRRAIVEGAGQGLDQDV